MHWKIVGIVTLVAVVAAYTSARRAVPRYRSDASFQVGSKKYGATRLEEPQVNELDIKTDPVLSEALFLKTQNLALAVADSLGLQLRLLDGRAGRADVLDNVRVALAAPNDTFALVLKGSAGYEVRDARGRVIDSGGYAVPVADTAHGFGFLVRPSDDSRTASRSRRMRSSCSRLFFSRASVLCARTASGTSSSDPSSIAQCATARCFTAGAAAAPQRMCCRVGR